MKEVRFLNKNAQRWQQFEMLLNNPNGSDADTLAELFVQITDDLAFSKTYYPNSKTTAYLNQLAQKAHQQIYKNKKESSNRIIKFWKTELPLEIKKQHKKLFYSTIVFFIAVLIGAISTANDDTFARLILTDDYVNMTLSNIEKGDPLGVYKHDSEASMFLRITVNNIKVSFWAFSLGLLFSIGTVWVLFQNGVMVGTFQYLFFKYGLLTESLFTVWIHGTIEISVIIVAGGAGMVVGNSLLFPKTLKRKTSFIQGARSGLKIVIGLVPFFIIAGILESFVTRHTEFSYLTRGTIIFLSLALIIWYFIIYPNLVYKKHIKNG